MTIKFVLVLEHYLIEVLPILATGFFISGLTHEFIPAGWIERYLERKGAKPIAYATLAGMAANAVFGGPRMGLIFGGMLLSGEKVAKMILERLEGR